MASLGHIVLASHPCTCVLHRQGSQLHTLKLPKFFHFHGDFHQKWHFAHPKTSFAHPELPFLTKSMLGHNQLTHYVLIFFFAEETQNYIYIFWFFFARKHKIIFVFSIIPRHQDEADRWYCSSRKTETHLCYIVNTKAAEDLATQGPRTSAAMILTQLSCNVLTSVEEYLRHKTEELNFRSFIPHINSYYDYSIILGQVDPKIDFIKNGNQDFHLT